MAQDTLRRVLPREGESLALHAHAASRLVEQAALETHPPHTLMQRAGLAVARLALAVAPRARSAWVACGPGNNGGDGLEAAIHLREAGWQVSVSHAHDPQRMPQDARHALARAREAGVRIDAAPAPAGPCDLAIDALLGLGSARAPEGWIASGVRALNSLEVPVLAVDLPSGLDAEHGRLLGHEAVLARHTLSLLTLKAGLFTGAGRDHAGTVWLDTLGVQADEPPAAWLVGRSAVQSLRPGRQHAQHKGSFGDVLVVGGAHGMTGAAWLAGTAALSAGAGRVYVDLLEGGEHAPPRLELMYRPGMARDDVPMLQRSTVVCGCGGGQAVLALLPQVLAYSTRLVLDADALNCMAASPGLMQALAQRVDGGCATVLTPHPLEAARLLGCSAADVQADRLAAAQALADKARCAVLLKGSGSVCSAPGHPPLINPTGNALLASAGTGDVLAGWCGGLWAQQAKVEDATAQAQSVAAATAWWHGLAADEAAGAGRQTPLAASLLVDAMAALQL